MKTDHLRALARVCRQFGGQLAVISQSAFDALFYEEGAPNSKCGGTELYDATFTDAHGLWWSRKIVYAVRGREQVGAVIHEMGHVFAATRHPDCYCGGECHEWNWFGWEVALARKIGAVRAWSRQNAHYQTDEGGGSMWGKLSIARRRTIVAKRLAHARKIGVLDADGAPRSIR
jgi:hypothetical protein